MLRVTTAGNDSPLSSRDLEGKARAAAAYRLLRQPGSKISIKNAGGSVAVPLEGEWSVENTEAEQYLKALENYQFVRQFFGVPTDGEVLPEELVRVGHMLNVFASIAGSRDVDAEVFFPKNDPPQGTTLGDHVSFLHSLALGFQGMRLVVATGISGRIEESNDGKLYRVRSTRLPLLAHRLFEYVTKEDVEALLSQGEQVLSSLGAAKIFVRPVAPIPKAWQPPKLSRRTRKRR